MEDFFRFPHTPHLAWLGSGSPRNDKVLSPNEVTSLLAKTVLVEEKMDGANIGFSLASDLSLRTQNRGQYLAEPHMGQFARLPTWLSQHEDSLRSALSPNIIIFGEWCAARHSLDYAELPDWFLVFDVYDRTAKKFWSSSRRNELALEAGLAVVPQIMRNKTSLTELKQLINSTSSRYRSGPLEGVVIRSESLDWCESKAKLVRPDFTQTIETHWSKRPIEWNRIDFCLHNQD